MGWCSYAAKYYKNGKVDRKAECDSYFTHYNNRYYRILKSVMVGTVYYAAVSCILKPNGQPIPENEQKVFAVIFLTHVDNKAEYNFYYKDMDETEGPYYYDCPESILRLLSPTDSEFAQKWRTKCYEKIKLQRAKANIRALPIGTQISINIDGQMHTLIKQPPNHQFKTDYWYEKATNSYVPKKYLQGDYTIIT